MMEQPLKIGIAGTGRMGAAIAARLLDRGHAVTVWNRTPAKTESLAAAGAMVAPTPRELSTAARHDHHHAYQRRGNRRRVSG
jgi:3-hydroxyisobutyrate dehydrogenase-like beta-hydroxyacid dehydrogenase